MLFTGGILCFVKNAAQNLTVKKSFAGYACLKSEAGYTQSAEVCPYCSYRPKAKDHYVGQCPICKRDSVLLRKSKVCDELGTRYMEISKSCAEKYEKPPSKKTTNEIDLFSVIKNTFSKHKKAIIGGIIAIIMIIIVIIISEANSGYTCSVCGKRIRERIYRSYWRISASRLTYYIYR